MKATSDGCYKVQTFGLCADDDLEYMLVDVSLGESGGSKQQVSFRLSYSPGWWGVEAQDILDLADLVRAELIKKSMLVNE